MTLPLPEECLPHRAPMLLIDSIIAVNEQSVSCLTTVREDNIFYDPNIGGIYAWVGIEFMAQATGVFAHFCNPQSTPALGFLISVRKFSCLRPHFKLGETLTIMANNEYLQDGVGVFQCCIISNGGIVASAKLNALQPPPHQVEALLKGESQND